MFVKYLIEQYISQEKFTKEIKERKPNMDKITTFSEYQKATAETAIYPTYDKTGIYYCTMKLASEAGEVGGKIGKTIRDNNCEITEEKIVEIGKELGDVLWYISQLCTEFNLDLDTVATTNIEKLSSRKKRGTIGGSGDNR